MSYENNSEYQRVLHAIHRHCEDFIRMSEEEKIDDPESQETWGKRLKAADRLLEVFRINGLMGEGKVYDLGLPAEDLSVIKEAVEAYAKGILYMNKNYEKEFEALLQRQDADGEWARKMEGEGGWHDKEAAFDEIFKLVKTGLLPINSFIGLKKFMNREAVLNMNRMLFSSDIQSGDVLRKAEEYQHFGLISPDEDKDIFKMLNSLNGMVA